MREDALRAAARLLVWAPRRPSTIAPSSTGDASAAGAGARARWEWWGARARRILAGRRHEGDGAVLRRAAVAHRRARAALARAVLRSTPRCASRPTQGNGDAARRFEVARALGGARAPRGTPPALRASLAAVAWARVDGGGRGRRGVRAGAGRRSSRRIVRALSARDRLRPLLEQVLDTMVLWTGVERGLLLLRAPDGRLVPRAARNLARHDLAGEQLALSQTIARRAIETGDAVVATDAFSTLGDAHASVHALRLRSVLAVPLLARGEALGVVYLDDRVRKGAFGPRELAWVRVVASQAAMAIADARDAVLLRRAARRAERARVRVEAPARASARPSSTATRTRARARPRRARDPLPLRRDRRAERADARAAAPGRSRDGERRPGARRRRERHRQGAHRPRDPRQRPARRAARS